MFPELKSEALFLKSTYFDSESCEILGFHSAVNAKALHNTLLIPSCYKNDALLLHLINSISKTDFHSLDGQNIFNLKPNENGKILMEDARIAIDFANKSTLSGKEKFIIIDLTSPLSLNVSNALLKVVEEPPEDTFFLLVYSNINSILPTVKSRCLIVHYKNSVSNFNFLCTINKIASEDISLVQELTSCKIDLMYLFSDAKSICLVKDFESLIGKKFNYCLLKAFYKKYSNFVFFKELCFLCLEFIFVKNIRSKLLDVNLTNLYSSFLSKKKDVKLYNTNLELFLYSTAYSICQNVH